MLPPTIGKLAALKELWLPGTKVSGEFSGVVIGPFFIILSVGSGRDLNAPFHCFLTRAAACICFLHCTRAGVLPAELGKLTKLTLMHFYGTKVSGRFVGRFVIGPCVHNYQSAPYY